MPRIVPRIGVQLDLRHGVRPTLGDVQRALVWRERQAIRIASLETARVQEYVLRRGYRKLRQQPIVLRIHDGHRVAVIAGHVKPRAAAIEDHLVGRPAHGDARGDMRCLVRRLPQRHDHDFSVANAGDVGFIVPFDRHPKRIFAARRALFGGIALPGSQIEFRNLRARSEIHHANRIVLVICRQQSRPCRIHGDSRHFRRNHQPQPRRMAQTHRRSHLVPDGALAAERMHHVLLAPGNVELVPVRIPRQAIERARHLHDLRLLGWLRRDVVNEDVLAGILRNQIAALLVTNVVPAGEDQQRAAVGAHGRGDGLARREGGRVGQVRIQRRKAGARRRGRSDAHARRKFGWLGGAGVVVIVVRQPARLDSWDNSGQSQKEKGRRKQGGQACSHRLFYSKCSVLHHRDLSIVSHENTGGMEVI